MSTPAIRFTNGAAYERFMGIWSRSAGEEFLRWVAPPAGGRWLDVGCGNGAFTELIAARCAPAAIDGLDPSPEQLAHAAAQPALRAARFHQGDAMALPFPAASMDAAVMPLVIFFVPVPAQGVAEMARVVRPGGTVCAYAWDMSGGGFPYFPLHTVLEDMGFTVPTAPNPEASRLETLAALWQEAGLADVATRAITVQRTYADFDDYWTTIQGAPTAGPTLSALDAGGRAELQRRLRERLPAAADGSITCSARANAVKGRVRS
jgi:ubiquinone/menaquinone biosynthesis C-methylase UbiE